MALHVDDRVYANNEGEPWPCQSFALCDNLANGLRDHPALGQVPICKRWDDKIEGMGE